MPKTPGGSELSDKKQLDKARRDLARAFEKFEAIDPLKRPELSPPEDDFKNKFTTTERKRAGSDRKRKEELRAAISDNSKVFKSYTAESNKGGTEEGSEESRIVDFLDKLSQKYPNEVKKKKQDSKTVETPDPELERQVETDQQKVLESHEALVAKVGADKAKEIVGPEIMSIIERLKNKLPEQPKSPEEVFEDETEGEEAIDRVNNFLGKVASGGFPEDLPDGFSAAEKLGLKEAKKGLKESLVTLQNQTKVTEANKNHFNARDLILASTDKELEIYKDLGFDPSIALRRKEARSGGLIKDMGLDWPKFAKEKLHIDVEGDEKDWTEGEFHVLMRRRQDFGPDRYWNQDRIKNAKKDPEKLAGLKAQHEKYIDKYLPETIEDLEVMTRLIGEVKRTDDIVGRVLFRLSDLLLRFDTVSQKKRKNRQNKQRLVDALRDFFKANPDDKLKLTRHYFIRDFLAKEQIVVPGGYKPEKKPEGIRMIKKDFDKKVQQLTNLLGSDEALKLLKAEVNNFDELQTMTEEDLSMLSMSDEYTL